MFRRALLASFLVLAASGAHAQAPTPAQMHERAIVLDTHFDTPANFSARGWSIMDRHDYAVDGTQVDYPRMVEGGVDGGVFVVFTPQRGRDVVADMWSRDHALLRTVEILEMTARHHEHFVLVTTADEARAAVAEGRKFVFISLENGAPLAGDLSLMQTFYRLGVRMMGPVHFANNDLADSSTDPAGPEWGGLSEKGRAFVRHANDLGIVIDPSHASDAALDQMLELSRAPLVLSHSGVKAVYDHPRNIPDDLLRKLADKGGVIQVNAFSGYMVETPRIPERNAALIALTEKYGPQRDVKPEQREAYLAERAAIEAKYPLPRANMDDLMQHILHVVETVGIDHVGLSGDFDGGGGIEGLEDVTTFPALTERLVAAGFTQSDLDKFWGGNVLRVMEQVQAAAAR
ncbi:MAG: dipeptidase [Phenylobacterium sp.]|uniref:dipeptidase n=1 Tax=Phenylobacterium sp. TaxID=1871053 RepID=UPI00272542C9|nr:dipeptidase [Phenylobacterium sp.]MDO8901943.1 dipeptidase [Phenylobacterium sp.]